MPHRLNLIDHIYIRQFEPEASRNSAMIRLRTRKIKTSHGHFAEVPKLQTQRDHSWQEYVPGHGTYIAWSCRSRVFQCNPKPCQTTWRVRRSINESTVILYVNIILLKWSNFNYLQIVPTEPSQLLFEIMTPESELCGRDAVFEIFFCPNRPIQELDKFIELT